MRYSKRHIKGLPSPKEIVIKSLSDYIKLFSTDNFSNFIFRGEPTNFYNTISSALRDGEYPYIQMKNEYKREIYHRLTDDERKDFLAFAQHHGLPTNLIDFTRSPLIALFFACQPYLDSASKFDTSRGFVYLLNDDLIDITDILSGHEDDNLLERFSKNEEGLLMSLYEKLVIFEKNHPEKFHYYLKKLNDDWKYYLVDFQSPFSKSSRFPKYNDGNYEFKMNYKFTKENRELIRIIEKNSILRLPVLEYVLMLQEFLREIKNFQATTWWLNCIPNFIYSPFITFERGRNQQGLFVYQAHLSYDEDIYGTHIISQQRVWPEFVIVVENKETILQELDFIGINEKFIFGDFDSIAKYIKNKYV